VLLAQEARAIARRRSLPTGASLLAIARKGPTPDTPERL